MVEVAGSSYLDFMSWRYNDADTVPEAFGFDSGTLYPLTSDVTLNLALVIERANDPAALLALPWAERQKALADLAEAGTLWDQYGGRATDYAAVVAGLADKGIAVEDAASGYVSSAEARSVWISVTPQQFFDLTGQRLSWVGGSADDPWAIYWEGNLTLPDAWGGLVKGLWVDTFVVPDQSGTGTGATLPQGPQSPGNATDLSYESVSFSADAIARLYNFPLSTDTTLPLGLLGLVEPAVGTGLPSSAGANFQTLMDRFRESAGVSTGAPVFQVGNAGAWYQVSDRAGERSLDVGVAGIINPGAAMALYSGPGLANQSNYTGYQGAIWDTVNNPAVLTSSWTDEMSPAPGSAFFSAYRELFVDAALRGITMFNDASDGGSGAQIGNGLTNVWQNNTSAYVVVVGGTSLSTPVAAAADATLSDIVASARALDRPTLAALVAGGLKTLPADAAAYSLFIETVWNQYVLSGTDLDPGYATNETTGGGVDITQGVPAYQLAFGLNPQGLGPSSGTGRGSPDVSALAGGNMFYVLPSSNMEVVERGGYGTSAATPLWASLGLQVNAILRDQGVPYALGYMTDLLYNAAVIAPAAFNDIRVGNNTSTFIYGGGISTPDDGSGTFDITPLGIGYSAAPGYDLVTGLGSPNGVLLARALSTIVHTQLWSQAPALAEEAGGGLVSGVRQALLLQPVLGAASSYEVSVGGQVFSATGAFTAPEAWSRQFAQQVLQWDFDPALVTLFDGLAQARPHEAIAEIGAGLSATIAGHAATTPQASFSLGYGFVDFVGASGTSAVEFARPVAIAANAGGLDDMEAVVRVRQSGMSEGLSLTFCRVDDLDGAIGGVQPGDAAYGAHALERAYALSGGGTRLDGPGFGNYVQSALLGVDQGDIIAMILTNAHPGDAAHTFYAFAAANETVDGQGVAHLWNYGLNTWGWEDLYGGGDLDYNDLVVQLDFTSMAGSGVLV